MSKTSVDWADSVAVERLGFGLCSSALWAYGNWGCCIHNSWRKTAGVGHLAMMTASGWI